MPRNNAPIYPGLEIPDCRGELTPENAKLVKKYQIDCQQFSNEVAQLHADRASLIENAPATTLADTRAKGAELRSRKAELENRLRQLLWGLFEIRQALLPDFEKASADAVANYEEEIEAVTVTFRSMGIDEMAMEAGSANIVAAQRQLRQRIMQEEPCMAALAHKRRCDQDLNGLKAVVDNPPREKRCCISWQGAADQAVASLAGVA